MESLLSLFGGGGAAGAAPSSGLSYLGGAQVNPSTIGTPGNGNPNFGPAQGGQSFGQMMGNMGTRLLQQKMQGGGGGGAAAGAGDGGMNASGGYMGGHLSF